MGIKMKNFVHCRCLGIGIFCFLVVALSMPAHAKDSLLVIRAHGRDYEQTTAGLTNELEEDISVTEFVIGKKTTKGDIARKMRDVSPRIVVLMDNSAIILYRKYQKELPASAPVIPSVSLMAAFTELVIRGMKNATGISYEVPIVTSIVNLRAILDMPTDKVGIVHREFFREFVSRNAAYCANENIDLVSYAIPDKGRIKSNLNKGLKFLKKNGVGAIWVPNDSNIVNNRLLGSVWIPFTRKYKKPVIVGVEILVRPKLNFGTFAVIPDNISLGIQAAEMILDAMDNNWQVETGMVASPRSVYKIINFRQAGHQFNISEENLQDVDKVLK